MLIDPKKTKDEIIQWIRKYFAENGPGCSAVVGISGGKDSSVVAALCVEALGKERVIGVLMPNGEQADIRDSHRVVDVLGIDCKVVNIGDIYWATAEALEGIMHVSEQARINLPPRIRMAVLYAVAQSIPEGGRVANTCNRSEDFVGYSTKFGDGVGDFSPLSNLMVHYEQIDQYIMTGSSGDKMVDEAIKRMHEKNQHKLKPMPTYRNEPG